MKLYKRFAVLALVGASMTLAASPAIADDSPGTAGTVEVGGREYGPADGVSVTTESFEITPGTGSTVGLEYPTSPEPGVISPLATWGASYAISTEYAYLFYQGKARAAGNVYSGERIIQVCMQYTRDGAAVADQRCSNAVNTGTSWQSGPEVLSNAADSPAWTGPPTVFNIKTTRIDPSIL